MKRNLLLLLLCAAVIILSKSYVLSNNEHQALHLSDNYYDYLQPNFSDYLILTQRWLAKNRSFISSNHAQELEMNMPFEAGDPNSEKAILLVHGLGDSPYSFSDLTSTFVKQGFYVQAILLPGHGSKPEHMKLTTYNDWQVIVDYYVSLLKKEHTQVWLGGFSTGANLISINALNYGGIEGLVLISPGFKTMNPGAEKIGTVISIFWDGIIEHEDNYAKYNSMSLHGMTQYSESARIFRSTIDQKKVTVPTLIVVSEADSVIDPYITAEMFNAKFTNPQSKLIWYGDEQHLTVTERVQSYPMNLAEYKISTGSHLSPLFSPVNRYYGANGTHLVCLNSLDTTQTERCYEGDNVWFSAWGYKEQGKTYARLTWNPYFARLENEISNIVLTDDRH
ncbi:phospholipase [Vibrio sp. 10N.286.49.B3]|uniref:alpha/beta hydrolase n=1 Tax=Vibrio sp. 10N.286.49.B3 TaxID=1880855 RepID=UPI000C857F6F|nr:alpha/beta fold hydrolase [Vibrio sp. 10N.286.49.B3]PMH44881.1 phospholipase [Vibrio sp. 10N.286.49.B3]